MQKSSAFIRLRLHAWTKFLGFMLNTDVYSYSFRYSVLLQFFLDICNKADMLQQIAFIIILLASYFIRKRVLLIRANVNLGKDKKFQRPAQRFQTLCCVAFGQKKMFKRSSRNPSFVYLHWLFGINLEVLEFIIDGLAGTHRIFAPFLGDFYNVR